MHFENLSARLGAPKHATHPLLQAHPFRKPSKRRSGPFQYRHLSLPRITEQEMRS